MQWTTSISGIDQFGPQYAVCAWTFPNISTPVTFSASAILNLVVGVSMYFTIRNNASISPPTIFNIAYLSNITLTRIG